MTMRKVPKRVGSMASASRVTLLAPVVHAMLAGVAAGKRRPRAFAFITQPRRSGHGAGSAMHAISGARRALRPRGRCDGHATLFQLRSDTEPPCVASVATGATAAASPLADDPEPVRARGSSPDRAPGEQLLGAVCPAPGPSSEPGARTGPTLNRAGTPQPGVVTDGLRAGGGGVWSNLFAHMWGRGVGEAAR